MQATLYTEFPKFGQHIHTLWKYFNRLSCLFAEDFKVLAIDLIFFSFAILHFLFEIVVMIEIGDWDCSVLLIFFIYI
jgi:hypothetical protein